MPISHSHLTNCPTWLTAARIREEQLNDCYLWTRVGESFTQLRGPGCGCSSEHTSVCCNTAIINVLALFPTPHRSPQQHNHHLCQTWGSSATSAACRARLAQSSRRQPELVCLASHPVQRHFFAHILTPCCCQQMCSALCDCLTVVFCCPCRCCCGCPKVRAGQVDLHSTN